MLKIAKTPTILFSTLIACTVAFPNQSQATTVRFSTNVGSFDVALFDEAAPITVANFLDYVNSGVYDNSIIHRSVPSFVIQGGGYGTDLSALPANDPIINESSISNTRGTIAMARTQDPDSATNQWFFNVVDNDFLDDQSGGFAVFGEVLGDGMSVISDINDLSRNSENGSPFFDLPTLEPNLGTSPENLVVIESIAVVPEPSTSILALLALISVVGRSRSRSS